MATPLLFSCRPTLEFVPVQVFSSPWRRFFALEIPTCVFCRVDLSFKLTLKMSLFKFNCRDGAKWVSCSWLQARECVMSLVWKWKLFLQATEDSAMWAIHRKKFVRFRQKLAQLVHVSLMDFCILLSKSAFVSLPRFCAKFINFLDWLNFKILVEEMKFDRVATRRARRSSFKSQVGKQKREIRFRAHQQSKIINFACEKKAMWPDHKKFTSFRFQSMSAVSSDCHMIAGF